MSENKQSALDLAFEVSKSETMRETQRTQTILDFYDKSKPDQRQNNVNLAKIIWKLKFKTTLLQNVLNQIINKWPEDRISFLDIIENNKQKYSIAPQDLIDLVNKSDIDYKEIVENPAFNIAEDLYPSRAKQSNLKRGI